MRQIILPTMFLCIITINACSTRQKQEYQPSFESLKKTNPVPEWFRDAKFGIHFHWGGVYSVSAFANEWYPRNMYI
jgi:alpha-L-fucosidase